MSILQTLHILDVLFNHANSRRARASANFAMRLSAFFNLYGYTNDQSSFIREFGFKSELNKDYAALINERIGLGI